jgi:hypothetical protein
VTGPTVRTASPADVAAVLEQGCRRITALVVTAEDHATGFWAHVDYGADARITRHVKTTG